MQDMNKTALGGDCLLWIDGPYKTVAQFVKEAETRGCCRRMSTWPPWVRPGETRVFLAHRNGHVRTDYGSIFGYFTLGGVGILGNPKKPRSPRKPPKSPPEDRPLPKPPEQPPGPRPPTNGGEPPRDGGYEISPNQTPYEPDRFCGARSEEGAIYFVDALARRIDSMFGKALGQQAAVRGGVPGDTAPSSHTFSEVVKQASPPPQPRVSETIEGHAHGRGALIVLEPPFPSFQRIPQAAFRDLLRIDGDTLLERIATAYAQSDSNRVVRIAYHRTVTGKRKTKAQLVTDLAEELQASKAFSGSVWSVFAEMIATELKKREWMTLTGVGTFRVKTANDSKQVTFKPSEVLGRKI
jgi:nucleoid DNA-binding protein